MNKKKFVKVVACINHDATAIGSHQLNHKKTKHFLEDITTFNLAPLLLIVQKIRKKDPNAVICLWASLECTQFSKAKGGLPREADSRTLANHLFRYIEGIKPDYILIENVEEFMSWGDLDDNGKPLSMRKGTDYIKWCNRVQEYGYNMNQDILDAANYGAYTSRKRLFIIFSKPGLPNVFPEPTHAKEPQKEGMFGKLEKWKAVKEVLNLNDVGESIFGRKKDLSEKTLERIYAGLIKFVAGGKKQFLVKYNSMNRKGAYVPPDMNNPAPSLPTRNMLYLTTPQFLASYFGNGDNIRHVSNPAPSQGTKDTSALVTAQFLYRDFSNGGSHKSIEEPHGSLQQFPKSSVVTAIKFLMNPQWGSAGSDVDNPCFTLIAGMDKTPPYIITVEENVYAIEVYEHDSPMTRKIKEFMAMYGIADIKMRMLRINELLRIMGFGDKYKLKGTQAEQKKQIGNAVEVTQSMVIAEALYNKLHLAA